jgi:hypothetical protein
MTVCFESHEVSLNNTYLIKLHQTHPGQNSMAF